MKVSFIIPTHLYKYQFPAPLSMSDFPVGMAYIASSVRAAGHEVAGCNPNNRYDFASAKEMMVDTVTRHLDEHKPDVVCLGGICTDYAFLRDCSKVIRERTKAAIVMGGGIIGYDPDRAFDILEPDVAVKGDGEHIMPPLLECLGAGREPANINNIIYRWQGKRQKTTEDFHYPDIRTHLYPAFELFGAKDMLDRFSLGARPLYRYPHEHGKPWVVVAGRGCPFRCTFCVHERETPYSFRPPQDVMDELAHFHKEYDFNVLIILDELFAPNRKRMIEFAEAMIKLRKEQDWDLRWTMQTHANVGLKQEDVNLAKEAGMYEFSYGMESASKTILKSMKKNSRPEQIAEVIPMTRNAGVGFGGNYIFGDPAETEATMEETMDFFKANCRDLHMSLGSIQPYPGSQLWSKCIEDGTITDPKAFYEAIDERRYVMAQFPQKPWYLWCGLMGFFGGKGLWHLAAPAKVVGREKTDEFDTLVLKAHCPHCEEKFTYRHPLVARQANKSIAVSQSPLVGMILKFKSKRLFTWLLLQFAGLASLRYRWFRHLKLMARPGAETENSTVTGCPNCNQAVRVEWSPVKSKLRYALPQNTGNSMHYVVGKHAGPGAQTGV
jgi:anaerobic magnesium-protoporphyrin IX monomethyl ester cyclase